MRRRAALTGAGLLLGGATGARGQTSLLPFPIPAELMRPLAFTWLGRLEDAVQALSARLGYSSWLGMVTGLAVPSPPPPVAVSISVSSATAAEIVVLLNEQTVPRALVVLDPELRSVGVIYYG